jgi:hypothetical protein
MDHAWTNAACRPPTMPDCLRRAGSLLRPQLLTRGSRRFVRGDAAQSTPVLLISVAAAFVCWRAAHDL